MGFPTDPAKYPKEFAALYRRAIKEKFEIELGDRGTAINFVHKLHAYRRAVEDSAEIMDSSMRIIVIRQRGTRIIFDNDTTAMDAIRTAAGMEAPSAEDLDTYLAKLEQGMNKDDNRSIPSTDSGESAIYTNQEQEEGKVETDYLKLFKTTEDSEDKEQSNSS